MISRRSRVAYRSSVLNSFRAATKPPSHRRTTSSLSSRDTGTRTMTGKEEEEDSPSKAPPLVGPTNGKDDNHAAAAAVVVGDVQQAATTTPAAAGVHLQGKRIVGEDDVRGCKQANIIMGTRGGFEVFDLVATPREIQIDLMNGA